MLEIFICGTCNDCGYLFLEAVEDGEPQDVCGQILAKIIKKKCKTKLENQRPKIKKCRTAVDSPAKYLNTSPPPQDCLETKSHLLTVL